MQGGAAAVFQVCPMPLQDGFFLGGKPRLHRPRLGVGARRRAGRWGRHGRRGPLPATHLVQHGVHAGLDLGRGRRCVALCRRGGRGRAPPFGTAGTRPPLVVLALEQRAPALTAPQRALQCRAVAQRLAFFLGHGLQPGRHVVHEPVLQPAWWWEGGEGGGSGEAARRGAAGNGSRQSPPGRRSPFLEAAGWAGCPARAGRSGGPSSAHPSILASSLGSRGRAPTNSGNSLPSTLSWMPSWRNRTAEGSGRRPLPTSGSMPVTMEAPKSAGTPRPPPE